MTRIVAISDTHRMHDRITVPDGDVLVHAGDFCSRGELREVAPFVNWLTRQPHAHKVLIAGNHDECFEKSPECIPSLLAGTGIHYLHDSGA